MRYASSYGEAVDTVARERKYLSMTHGYTIESTQRLVKLIIEKSIPALFAIDTEADRCVGWCDALVRTMQTGYLGIGLLADYRDQGIGTRLIEGVVQQSRAFGYSELILDVRAANVRAIHLYKKIGFEVSEVVQSGFTLDAQSPPEDLIKMRLSL